MKSRLFIIFLILFMDVLGFGLILPLLPYYAHTYGASAWITGLLVATYALMQFIGAPILGRWSDQRGRRPILLISIFGTALGFALMGAAEWIGWTLFGKGTMLAGITILALLFLSRFLDGLTGGNFSVAQAYITDVTDDENRAKGLGMIGAAFGMGFIFGPATGGFLSKFGFAAPAWAAFAVSVLNWGLVYAYLPESLSEERRAEMRAHPRPPLRLNLLWTTLQHPKVGPLFITRFAFGLAFGLFQSIFSLYAAGAPLHLSAEQNGYVLSYVGILSAIMQGAVVARLAKRFPEQRLAFIGAGVTILGFIGWAFTLNVPMILGVITLFAIGVSLLGMMLSTILTKSVDPHEMGQTLGMGASYDSLTRIIAPTLGGWLLSQFGASAPGFAGAIIMILTFWYMRKTFPLVQPKA